MAATQSRYVKLTVVLTTEQQVWVLANPRVEDILGSYDTQHPMAKSVIEEVVEALIAELGPRE